MANIKVKLVKSLIGSKKDQIATAYALGLHKIGDVSVQPDNAATKGKIKKIAHLIEATEE
ncbi:MAG: 50S ribosomal protein L30 [Clostridia bacterium]|jgi:large subunit ribosomal protein L30|nr:50S ribosomal protein L30 [Clostridia bacterium]MBO5462793.1 50S ribosomal protein L30 [Clostridia bacterium]